MKRLLSITTALALSIAGCGSSVSLTDAQLIWCGKHNMTPLAGFAAAGVSDTVDDAVISAAKGLKIQVPAIVLEADSIFIARNLDAGAPFNPPTGWPDAMKQWQTTADYARACIAAYDLK